MTNSPHDDADDADLAEQQTPIDEEEDLDVRRRDDVDEGDLPEQATLVPEDDDDHGSAGLVNRAPLRSDACPDPPTSVAPLTRRPRACPGCCATSPAHRRNRCRSGVRRSVRPAGLGTTWPSVLSGWSVLFRFG